MHIGLLVLEGLDQFNCENPSDSSYVQPGVNTFHIDMKEHKVTVIGNVYPNEVLECVNKVIKGVKFWETTAKPHNSFE